RRPDKSAVLRSLRHLPDAVGREALLDVLGDAHRFGSVFFQVVGASAVDAKRFIGESRVNSSMPEGLRVAHLVACGLTRGESAGRA
ncbi:MAG: DUF99 family protein, partial [Candidatus Diapherotrites archaeon]|nr:DUF99 family protein [Candidatus Diapherotrites archaeon]